MSSENYTWIKINPSGIYRKRNSEIEMISDNLDYWAHAISKVEDVEIEECEVEEDTYYVLLPNGDLLNILTQEFASTTVH